MARIAVKSFIMNSKNEVLIIRRANNDEYKAGVWELPGGKLDDGENPISGLKRETKEEAGVDISVGNPLKVHHFERLGEKLTLISFLCKHLEGSVVLSEEHSDYEWVHIDEVHSKIGEFFHGEVELVKNKFV